MIPALLGLPGKMKTLLDRLTSARAGYLDYLDAAISTRAASSTALSTATWTGTKAGYLDAAISSRLTAVLASRQDGLVDTSSLSTGTAPQNRYLDVTISSVTTSKVLIISHVRWGTDASGASAALATARKCVDSPESNLCQAYLVNSTTLRFYFGTSDTYSAMSGRWAVLAFN